MYIHLAEGSYKWYNRKGTPLCVIFTFSHGGWVGNHTCHYINQRVTSRLGQISSNRLTFTFKHSHPIHTYSFMYACPDWSKTLSLPQVSSSGSTSVSCCPARWGGAAQVMAVCTKDVLRNCQSHSALQSQIKSLPAIPPKSQSLRKEEQHEDNWWSLSMYVTVN